MGSEMCIRDRGSEAAGPEPPPNSGQPTTSSDESALPAAAVPMGVGGGTLGSVSGGTMSVSGNTMSTELISDESLRAEAGLVAVVSEGAGSGAPRSSGTQTLPKASALVPPPRNKFKKFKEQLADCLLYTSPSPRDS